MKILVSRTDRAGDFLLTLPIFRELRRMFPQAHLCARVKPYTASIARLCPEIDEILLTEDKAHITSLLAEAKVLKQAGFDRAIIVHPSAATIISARLAGITTRTGRASNLWQFLLNDGRVQKRSRNEKHEFCYNLDLICDLVKDTDYRPYRFKLQKNQLDTGRELLARTGFTNERPVIVHPGHGGSAHNLAPEAYATMASTLNQMNIPVLISLGPGEEHLATHFGEPLRGLKSFLTDIPDFEQLALAFANCSAFIGGSTGPLHLAAALNLPCAAFFPPVKAMTPVRWGPTCDLKLVITPDLPACNGRCDECKHRPCMHQLDIHRAIAWVNKHRTSYEPPT